ncbi:MAG: hypothetical protein N3H84_07475 [Candidatus Caldarchaeum sp.]|nr:hypothetical protein [Candidatus Caldarchaeum sp.]
MLEDILILLAVFAATTIAGLFYVLFKSQPKQPEEKTIHVSVADLPQQTDTRLAPIILQTEQNIESFEKMAEKLLEEVGDEGKENSG